MKSKFSKILSVGLVVAVLASLLVISTPASAGNMSWTKDSAPTTVSNIDILDIAVASNGTTAYGVSSENNTVYKTPDGGKTWAKVLGFATQGQAKRIAVAPDSADGSFVAVLADNNELYLSDDGGASFWDYSPVGATVLNDVSISTTVAGGRVVAVAGSDGTAALYYRTIGTAGLGGSSWVDAFTYDSGNVTGTGTALAVEISPIYGSDFTMVVVTNTGSNAVVNLYNAITQKWNAGLLSYGALWTGGVSLGVNAARAEVALPGTFSGFQASTRTAYIALDTAIASPPTGGLVRMKDVAKTTLSATAMYSVSVNGAGDKLIAGALGTNDVYRASGPADAVAVTGANKPPSYFGTGKVTVRFFGTSVGAATAGNTPAAGDESAFALSTDDGNSFNDVALIDAAATVKDLAVNADGSKYYLVTQNGAGAFSLWRKTTAWERVYKMAGASYIVRPAADNFDVVYFADKGGYSIHYSNDAGQTWNPRSSWVIITDLVAETASNVYVLSGTGIIKSTTGANGWTTATTAPTGAGTGNSITLVSAGNVLVAGSTGFAYTTDGAATWTAVALGAPSVSYAVASSLASGGKIYAASGASVYVYTIGTSTGWPTTASGTAGFAVNGIALNSGLAYAMSSNTSESSYVRSGVTGPWQTKVAAGTSFMRLKAASGGNLYTLNALDNAVYKFTEIFAAAGPTLTGPADKFIVPINIETGNANNVVFQWTPIPNATGATYELVIALDSAFAQPVKTFSGRSGDLAIVGYTADLGFSWQADTTYYWRMRADSPFDSPWSATRSFKIDTLAPVKLVSPTNGAMDVSVTPTFAWSPAAGATGYELVVSDDPTFAIITFSRTSTQAVFASDEQLAYSTVYYWRVRPTGPAYPSTATAYVTGIFTTEERAPEPTTPPPTTTTTTTITISVPPATEAIPAYLLWIIIGIGAILVIALIVLIVRTRRVS